MDNTVDVSGGAAVEGLYMHVKPPLETSWIQLGKVCRSLEAFGATVVVQMGVPLRNKTASECNKWVAEQRFKVGATAVLKCCLNLVVTVMSEWCVNWDATGCLS